MLSSCLPAFDGLSRDLLDHDFPSLAILLFMFVHSWHMPSSSSLPYPSDDVLDVTDSSYLCGRDSLSERCVSWCFGITLFLRYGLYSFADRYSFADIGFWFSLRKLLARHRGFIFYRRSFKQPDIFSALLVFGPQFFCLD